MLTRGDLASSAVAFSCCVSPMLVSATGPAGFTVTDATAWSTVRMTAAEVTPPAVAVIWVWPSPVAVASPEASMPATTVAVEFQVKLTPGTAFPLPSRATAVNCWVSPMLVSVPGVAGESR